MLIYSITKGLYMPKKTFTYASDLVRFVLNSQLDQNKTVEQLKSMSQTGIVQFYQNEILPLVHLCSRPVTFQNVNRRVEEWIKAKQSI